MKRVRAVWRVVERNGREAVCGVTMATAMRPSAPMASQIDLTLENSDATAL